MLGHLIADASAEVRNAAKRAFLEILRKVNSRQEFYQLLRRSMQETMYNKLKAIAEKEQPEELFVHNGVCGL
jgi:hypothetical protein